MSLKKHFITAIGTGVGKTFVSALLCQQYGADYWKPIQAGYSEGSDSEWVKKHITHPTVKIHPEAYRLKYALSPHIAAEMENITIVPENIKTPNTTNAHLIIEGAGGLMVPINENFLMIDLIQRLEAEVILVISNYLGSINHTLLSLELIKQRGLPLKGIIINGVQRNSSEKMYEKFANAPILGRVPNVNNHPKVIEELSKQVVLSL